MLNTEYESCPVGIKNTAEIKHLAEVFDFRLDAMVERIEEKIDTMNDKIQVEFKQMNDKIDSVNGTVAALNKKVDNLDEKLDGVDNLENFIEEKIHNSTKDKVFNFVKWVVVTLVGSGVIAVFTKMVTKIVE
jgi:predicted nuclease with TOPRIM domain